MQHKINVHWLYMYYEKRGCVSGAGLAEEPEIDLGLSVQHSTNTTKNQHNFVEFLTIYRIAGNFGEVLIWWFGEFGKDRQIKNSPIWIIACVHAYDTKNSDRQIKNSPIPTENQFAKFNARQIFPLYGYIYAWCSGVD